MTECPCNCNSCIDCENYAEQKVITENKRVLDEAISKFDDGIDYDVAEIRMFLNELRLKGDEK